MHRVVTLCAACEFTIALADVTRGSRLRRLRHAVRRTFGRAALRIVLARRRREALAALALETARVDLAEKPDAPLRSVLANHARCAGIRVRSARSRARRRAHRHTDARVFAPCLVS